MSSKTDSPTHPAPAVTAPTPEERTMEYFRTIDDSKARIARFRREADDHRLLTQGGRVGLGRPWRARPRRD